MPNGRRRSQNTRAANRRRARERGRPRAEGGNLETAAELLHGVVTSGERIGLGDLPLPRLTAAATDTMIAALRRMDWTLGCTEAEAASTLTDLATMGAPVKLLEALSQLVHGASFHVIGGAVGHSSLFEMMMARLREGKLFIPVIADGAVAPLASAFRANTDWGGVEHDAFLALVRKLRIHGMSEVVVDAIEASYAAAAEASSSSSSDEDYVDVRGEEDLCRPCVQHYVPDPEPAPCDCATCCEPTAPALLIKCDTASACEYTQCIDCIIKGGGGTCDTPGCLRVHYKCPACRGHCGGFGLKLGDDRISKGHVVAMLDDARAIHRAAVLTHMEEMDAIMREMNRRIGELCSNTFGVVRTE